MSKIVSVKRHYIYIPYKAPVAPYWGWQAATYGAHGIIVEVHTADGLVGYGETAGREAQFFHQKAGEFVIGKDADNINGLTIELKANDHSNQAISGIEMALWDLKGKRCGLPLYQLLGGKVREQVPLCGLMGIKVPQDAVDTARLYRDEYGFKSIKTKAGRDAEEDLNIATALHNELGGSIKMRLDANQSYSIDEFVSLGTQLDELDSIEYFEQPVHHDLIQHLKGVREQLQLPIALNESVTDSKSVALIGRLQAADYLVPDIPDAGGIGEVLAIGNVAHASDLGCAFHCWHDMGIKTAAIAHVVSSQPAFGLACDSTYFGLENDIITAPFKISNGSITAPDLPGLGVEPDFDMIEKYRKENID